MSQTEIKPQTPSFPWQFKAEDIKAMMGPMKFVSPLEQFQADYLMQENAIAEAFFGKGFPYDSTLVANPNPAAWKQVEALQEAPGIPDLIQRLNSPIPAVRLKGLQSLAVSAAHSSSDWMNKQGRAALAELIRAYYHQHLVPLLPPSVLKTTMTTSAQTAPNVTLESLAKTLQDVGFDPEYEFSAEFNPQLKVPQPSGPKKHGLYLKLNGGPVETEQYVLLEDMKKKVQSAVASAAEMFIGETAAIVTKEEIVAQLQNQLLGYGVSDIQIVPTGSDGNKLEFDVTFKAPGLASTSPVRLPALVPLPQSRVAFWPGEILDGYEEEQFSAGQPGQENPEDAFTELAT